MPRHSRSSSEPESEAPNHSRGSTNRFVVFAKKRALALSVATGLVIASVITGFSTGLLNTGLAELGIKADPRIGDLAIVEARLFGPGDYTDNLWAFHQAYDVSPSDEQLVNARASSSSAVESYRSFIRSLDPVKIGDAGIAVTLTGNRSSDVRVEAVRVIIVKRDAPVTGTLWCHPSAGSSDTEKMWLDLDQDGPIPLTSDPRTGKDSAAYFQERNISLKQGELLPITISATTQQSDIQFRLAIDLKSGSEQETTVIDNGGRPFEVTAYGGAAAPDSIEGLRSYQRAYTILPGKGIQEIDPHSFQSKYGDDFVC